MATAHEMNIGKAYLALFGRVPELGGLDYWSNIIPQTASSAFVYNTLISSTQAANISISSDSNDYFIAGLYANALGKSVEEDRNGVLYWLNRLNNGDFATRGDLIAELFSEAATSPAFGNRLNVLEYAIDQQRTANKSMDLQSCVSCIRATLHSDISGTSIVNSVLGNPSFSDGWQNNPPNASGLYAASFQSPNYCMTRRYKEMWIKANKTAYAVQVYLPPSFNTGSYFPLVIALHGGGWRNGSPEQIDRYCDALAEQGFVVVAPNYRRSALYYTLDDMWKDLYSFKSIFTSAQTASLLKVDTGRVFWFGESAGAHLAIAYARNNAEKVMALYPPCNLLQPMPALAPYVAAAAPGSSARGAYSLVYGPQFSSSKIVLWQGALDTLVSPSECTAMQGPNCSVTVFPNQGHGFYQLVSAVPDTTMLDQVVSAAVSLYLG